MTAVAAVLAVVVSAQDPGAFEASFERGLAALAAGEYASAVESFEDALRIQPDHTQARFNLARALRELGEGAKALDQLLAIEDRMVDRFSFLLALARTRLDLRQLDEALVALDEAEALRPKAARVPYMKAEALAAQGKLDEARRMLARSAELQPEWVQPHLRLGEIALAVGDAVTAVSHLEKARTLAPEAPVVLVTLGDAQARAGKIVDALASWKRALELAPEMPKVQARIARALWTLGKRDESFAAYRAAVQLDPDDLQTRTAYALALFSLERSDDAAREFAEVLERDPDSGVALYYLGVTRESREDLERALPRLEGAEGDMPVLAGRAGESYAIRLAAAVELAEMMLASGELEQATALLEPVVNRAPDYATAHYHLGLAYRKLGRRDEATQALARFQRINDAREHDQLALKALESGDEARAIEELERALAIYPEDRVAHGELARIYLAQGDEGRSARHLEHVVEYTDSPESAFTDLLTYYCEVGDLDRARVVFERAVDRQLSIPRLCLHSP